MAPIEVEKDDYQLKPMNCPGHILIYKSRMRSYRDLPVRLAELGTVYRYERSGVLHGLLRVRGFTQDDAHIFCMPSQIEAEVEACVDFAFAVMKTFGFSRYQVELSEWDAAHPENYAGSREDWERSTSALSSTLERMQIPFKRMEGEAAFYGPKIDVKLIDAIGRPWQLTTVQFDFNLPERFGLEYVGEDGSRHQPLMVHRALWGSVERFFGILIEHYAGAFPLWLAPVQVAVLPVSNKFMRLRQGRRGGAERRRHSRHAGRPQREIAGQDSRFGDAEDSLHGRGGRQGSRSAHRFRAPSWPRRRGRAAAGGICRETARRGRRPHHLLGFSYFSDFFLRRGVPVLPGDTMLESRNTEERKRADWAFHNHRVLSARRGSCLRRRSAN